MRIDIHTHFQCLDFVKHLQGRSTLPKSVLDGGTYIIQCAPGLNVPALSKIIDMEKKQRDMEDMKIDVAVLSHGIPFGPDVFNGREADEWAARINDDLARILDCYPDKFVGLGQHWFRKLSAIDCRGGSLCQGARFQGLSNLFQPLQQVTRLRGFHSGS